MEVLGNEGKEGKREREREREMRMRTREKEGEEDEDESMDHGSKFMLSAGLNIQPKQFRIINNVI